MKHHRKGLVLPWFVFAMLAATGIPGSGQGGGNVAMDYSKEPAMPSGGGGLISTTVDYLRFYQMLLNGGELDGKRILSPSSVARELAALERADRRRGPKLSGQKADARERRYNT
jgi:CubicO group peptidase (beta-lactamase class C family)